MESFHYSRGLVLSSSKGFTLVELLVVLSIIVIITGVVLTSQSSFNKTLILSNTAYDIALTLRSAQTYGLSSRGRADASPNVGYGLHFDRSATGSFTLFADISPAPSESNCHGLPRGDAYAPDAKPGNCLYGAGDVRVSDYQLGNGIFIDDFCARSFGTWRCARANGAELSSLDIVFARPNPTPFIGGGAYSDACIALASPVGTVKRYISVALSGQIVANATACPP